MLQNLINFCHSITEAGLMNQRLTLLLILFLITASFLSAAELHRGENLSIDTSFTLGTAYKYEADFFPGRSGFLLTDAGWKTSGTYREKLKFSLNLELSEANTDDGEFLKNAYIQYDFFDPLRLRVGQSKTPFGYSYSQSSNERPNIYHSLGSKYIAPGRAVGIRLSGKKIGPGFSYALGFYNLSPITEDKNVSGHHRGVGNFEYSSRGLTAGYNIYFGTDEMFAHGLYISWEKSFGEEKNKTLRLLSEYMEQRYYNYHWNHSSYTLAAFRINNIEPLIYFDYFNDNIGYDGEHDIINPGIGFNAYFMKDRMQLKTDIQTQYLYSYPEWDNMKFFNTQLTIKLLVVLG